MSTKAPDRIRIKTLEEIRQAKAGSQKDVPAADAAETTKTELVRAAKATKRSITLTDAPIGHVKTFSEIIREKKMKQEEEQNQNPNLMKAEHPEEKAPAKGPGLTDAADVEKVRVKTLEEIRREKAARVQAQQTTDSPDPEHSAPKRPHLLRVKKSPTQRKKHKADLAHHRLIEPSG